MLGRKRLAEPMSVFTDVTLTLSISRFLKFDDGMGSVGVLQTAQGEKERERESYWRAVNFSAVLDVGSLLLKIYLFTVFCLHVCLHSRRFQIAL